MKCNVPKLTAKEMKAVREECQRQFDELLRVYNRQVVLQLLHVLHFEYGLGSSGWRPLPTGSRKCRPGCAPGMS